MSEAEKNALAGRRAAENLRLLVLKHYTERARTLRLRHPDSYRTLPEYIEAAQSMEELSRSYLPAEPAQPTPIP